MKRYPYHFCVYYLNSTIYHDVSSIEVMCMVKSLKFHYATSVWLALPHNHIIIVLFCYFSDVLVTIASTSIPIDLTLLLNVFTLFISIDLVTYNICVLIKYVVHIRY